MQKPWHAPVVECKRTVLFAASGRQDGSFLDVGIAKNDFLALVGESSEADCYNSVGSNQ